MRESAVSAERLLSLSATILSATILSAAILPDTAVGRLAGV